MERIGCSLIWLLLSRTRIYVCNPSSSSSHSLLLIHYFRRAAIDCDPSSSSSHSLFLIDYFRRSAIEAAFDLFLVEQRLIAYLLNLIEAAMESTPQQNSLFDAAGSAIEDIDLNNFINLDVENHVPFEFDLNARLDVFEDYTDSLSVQIAPPHNPDNGDFDDDVNAGNGGVVNLDNGDSVEEEEEESIGSMIEGEKSELMDKVLYSEEEAFALYNDYAFQKGFGVRKWRIKCRSEKAGGGLCMRQYVCYKHGKKNIRNKEQRAYTKRDVRTGCKAMIQFSISLSGEWTVKHHVMQHNHPLCDPKKTYYMRSHRKVRPEQLQFIENMKDSGIPVADSVRVLSKEAGGASCLGFIPSDAYSSLRKSSSKKFEGSDANTLIDKFKHRQEAEEDFFFDFELDDDGCLCSFFWRDARMKEDYELFGDLLVHDTTFRTNKYDMICGPFVGMNHHTKNVMFGCGFLLNERTESFIWLFKAFLKSMGGKQPKTIMTDQCAAMMAAIREVFPDSRHRLCVWHIGENSKSHIDFLRFQPGFIEHFNYVTMYCESEADFKFYWGRMLEQYNCRENAWLMRLYNIREMWCPAFSKDVFSGGILASQRSESTNQAISKRLRATSSLCDFYSNFNQVIFEWRSKEERFDFQEWEGPHEMFLDNVPILSNAREIYTAEMYRNFEDQFKKAAACVHEDPVNVDGWVHYEVWRLELDKFHHIVKFNRSSQEISCTCKLWEEVGILCSHCLHVFIINSVVSIPLKYIMKRWSKDVTRNRRIDLELCPTQNASRSSSAWRVHIIRKFVETASLSDNNKKTMAICDKRWKELDDEVRNELGIEAHFEELVRNEETTVLEESVIQNPIGKRIKGKKNLRLKSTREIKGNLARGRKKKSIEARKRSKEVVQSSVQAEKLIHSSIAA